MHCQYKIIKTPQIEHLGFSNVLFIRPTIEGMLLLKNDKNLWERLLAEGARKLEMIDVYTLLRTNEGIYPASGCHRVPEIILEKVISSKMSSWKSIDIS